jgi:hypothetical protein
MTMFHSYIKVYGRLQPTRWISVGICSWDLFFSPSTAEVLQKNHQPPEGILTVKSSPPDFMAMGLSELRSSNFAKIIRKMIPIFFLIKKLA